MKERWIAPCFRVPDGASCDGRLEPAGAQLHTESYQAERSNQTETAKPHDCLERMIVGTVMYLTGYFMIEDILALLK